MSVYFEEYCMYKDLLRLGAVFKNYLYIPPHKQTARNAITWSEKYLSHAEYVNVLGHIFYASFAGSSMIHNFTSPGRVSGFRVDEDYKWTELYVHG